MEWQWNGMKGLKYSILQSVSPKPRISPKKNGPFWAQTPGMVWESVTENDPKRKNSPRNDLGPHNYSTSHILYQHLPKGVERGCWLNPKGWCTGTPYHPFGTPWKIQLYNLWSTKTPIKQGGWYADQEGEHDFCGRERCVWSPNDSSPNSWTSILNMIPQFWGS